MSGARATSPKVVLGMLRLTDAAPVIIARDMGAFAEERLEVELSIEPSWANVADKIAYGLIDGAVMLPPLALAVSLGLRGARVPLVVPMSLSLKGNTDGRRPLLRRRRILSQRAGLGEPRRGARTKAARRCRPIATLPAALHKR